MPIDRNYIVVSHQDEVRLAAEVSEYIQRGYYPSGGVSVGKDGRFHQAVARAPQQTPAGETRLKEPKRK